MVNRRQERYAEVLLLQNSGRIRLPSPRGERSSAVGIGVGLHPGYNAAQRLYGRRGSIPGGRGITYRDRCLEEGAQIVLDDDLLLHLTKQHRPELR